MNGAKRGGGKGKRVKKRAPKRAGERQQALRGEEVNAERRERHKSSVEPREQKIRVVFDSRLEQSAAPRLTSSSWGSGVEGAGARRSGALSHTERLLTGRQDGQHTGWWSFPTTSSTSASGHHKKPKPGGRTVWLGGTGLNPAETRRPPWRTLRLDLWEQPVLLSELSPTSDQGPGGRAWRSSSVWLTSFLFLMYETETASYCKFPFLLKMGIL